MSLQWFRRQPVHHSETSASGCEIRKRTSLQVEIRRQRSRRKRQRHFIIRFPWRIQNWQRGAKKEKQTAKIQFPFPVRDEVEARQHCVTCPAEQKPSCKDKQYLHTHFCCLLLCNFGAQVSPLCRILRWQASLNVLESCGRTIKEGPMWSHLYQQLTWRGNT